jgi:hypothetical protein
MKKLLIMALAVASLATLTASANTISGNLWHVSEAISQNATFANVPGTTPYVTFSVNSPFNFSGSSVTVGTWLGSSGAFNIVENTAGTLASLMDDGSQGTLLDFVGFVSVVNGQTFTVTHDDGLQLQIGGLLVINAPGPTAPVITTVTYTGPTGNLPFELVYGECCGGPAQLQIDLPLSTTVPDGGSTLAMLAGAFGMIGAVSRRFRK